MSVDHTSGLGNVANLGYERRELDDAGSRIGCAGRRGTSPGYCCTATATATSRRVCRVVGPLEVRDKRSNEIVRILGLERLVRARDLFVADGSEAVHLQRHR